MPRSLVGRLIAILALLLAAAVAAGFVMVSLFQQSAAARIGQAGAVAGQSCGAVARAYRVASAGGADPDLAAVVASALGDKPGIEGGLWRAGVGPLAYGYPTYEGGAPKTDVPQAESARIADAVAATLAEDHSRLARFDARSETLLIATCPVSGPLPGLSAWTMTRVHSFSGGTYAQLMAGLAILSASVVGATVLAGLLAVTWARHVARIEAAFAATAGDDLPRLPATGERELDRIVLALNDAGRRLAGSRERTGALSRQVAEAERLAAVGRVAAGVAHEIRNPIAAMRLKSDSALRGGDERRVQALGLVIAQVDRLDRLVGRLLAVAERDPPRLRDVPLAAFLAECAAPHPDGAVSAAAGAPATARFDPDQMRRALDSLVANALQAGGAPVEIAAARDGDRLVLAVSDRGPGPPDDIAATLFEPFVTGRPENAGLGLSIVREIARAHGGGVEFARHGGATTFRIVLPCPAS